MSSLLSVWCHLELEKSDWDVVWRYPSLKRCCWKIQVKNFANIKIFEFHKLNI